MPVRNIRILPETNGVGKIVNLFNEYTILTPPLVSCFCYVLIHVATNITVAALEGIAPAVQAYGKCGFMCDKRPFALYAVVGYGWCGHVALDNMLSRLLLLCFRRRSGYLDAPVPPSQGSWFGSRFVVEMGSRRGHGFRLAVHGTHWCLDGMANSVGQR